MSERGGGLCDLLQRSGSVSASQMEHAVRVRAKLRPPRPLLQVLKELGVVSDLSVQEALSAHPGDVTADFVEVSQTPAGEVIQAVALRSGVQLRWPAGCTQPPPDAQSAPQPRLGVDCANR